MTAPDIIFIASYGRSGSTLLESTLRNRFDVMGVGELFFIWNRGVLKNELVGSGVPFRDSPFWTRILDRAFGGVSEAQARKFDNVFQSLRGNALRLTPASAWLPKDLTAFAEIARPLYEALVEEADGRVIVDSSKFPLFAAALAAVLDRKLGIVHAYRDPRAVAFSWSRVKWRAESTGGQQYMARSRFALSSVWRWKWFNYQAAQLEGAFGLPRVLVGYERFCADPNRYLDLISESFGLTPKFRADMEWQSVSGNPARFEGTMDQIVLDENWRREMPRLSRAFVGLTCGTSFRALTDQDAVQFGGST